GQRAIRLLITQAPQQRQFRMSNEPDVFRHDCDGIGRRDKEDVERQNSLRRLREKLAFGSGEVKTSEGLVNEHPPPRSSDDPGNRYAAAVRPQLVAALSAT